MATALFIIVAFLGVTHIGFISITDDSRVQKSLTKKELYNLSIAKDIISAIIIILLVIIPFIM